jgi:NTP pyrophosphatase (non-canonical NTP hydrolase)
MEQVTHPQLVNALVKDPMAILQTLSISSIDLWHGATGVAGECGELLEGILQCIELRDIDAGRENVMEESGDIYFYTEQLVQRAGLVLPWDLIDSYARRQIISPDRMLGYAASAAAFGSQALDTVKKCAVYNKELDAELLTSQLTDMLRYVVTLGYMFGVSRKQALEANIAKLSKRYEGLKYTDAAAHARADKVVERNYFGKEPAKSE